MTSLLIPMLAYPLPLVEVWALILLSGLLVVATLRLTRFVITDSLGGWLIRDRVERWAKHAERAQIRRWRLALGELERKREITPEDFTQEDAKIVLVRQEQIREGYPLSWQSKLAIGLGCPFCVGFWIGFALILGTLVSLIWAWLAWAWMVVLVALSLNYLVGHISSRIDM